MIHYRDVTYMIPVGDKGSWFPLHSRSLMVRNRHLQLNIRTSCVSILKHVVYVFCGCNQNTVIIFFYCLEGHNNKLCAV